MVYVFVKLSEYLLS